MAKRRKLRLRATRVILGVCVLMLLLAGVAVGKEADFEIGSVLSIDYSWSTGGVGSWIGFEKVVAPDRSLWARVITPIGNDMYYSPSWGIILGKKVLQKDGAFQRMVGTTIVLRKLSGGRLTGPQLQTRLSLLRCRYDLGLQMAFGSGIYLGDVHWIRYRLQ